MKKFILDLLSGNNDTSSKRFAGLSALFCVIACAIIAVIKTKGMLPEYFVNGLLFFAGTSLGFTAIEKIFKRKETE